MRKKRWIVLSFIITALAGLLLLAGCKEEFTVSFVTDGGTQISAITAGEGETIAPPEDPEKEGFVFTGWYLNEDFTGESVQIPTVMPAENRTYYAKFVKLARLEVDFGNGSQPSGYDLAVGTNISQFLADKIPQKSGYEFGGWYSGEAELRASETMTESGFSVTAKYKIGYTVNYFKQNLAGAYSSKPNDSQTAYDWAGTTVAGDRVSYEHFTVDTDRTESITLSENGENVINVYLQRKEYRIVYFANAPQGTVAEGSMENTAGLYEASVTVKQNEYRVEGYRFAGWATRASSEADPAFDPDTAIALEEGNVVLYATWEKGYIDRFGGGDRIYLPAREQGAAYLERYGLEEKRGVYDDRSGIFTFTTESGELKGRISFDGRFAYYGDENPGEYSLIDAYSQEPIADKNWKLTLDHYDGATITAGDQTYEGVYSIDEESGDFLFTAIGNAPAQFAEFFFTIGTYGKEETLAFAIRGEEYGFYYTKNQNSYGAPMLILDGYGIALLVVTSSSYSYAYYDMKEFVEETGELELSLIDLDTYTVSGSAYCKLLGKEIGYDDDDNPLELGVFLLKDALAGTYASLSGGDDSLELDGYGNAFYTENGRSVQGTYAVDGNVLILTVKGAENRAFIIDAERATFDAGLGNEVGSYYLYVPGDTLYTTTLTLDGKGGASWTAVISGMTRNLTGTYEYESGTQEVVCTVTEGTYAGQTFRFRLIEKQVQNTVYPAYLEYVGYEGVYANGNDRLTLDGYGFAEYAPAQGETLSGTYTVEQRTGFDNLFLLFAGKNDFTFQIDENGKTFASVAEEVGQYQLFAYNEGSGRFLFGDFYLKVENGLSATLTEKKTWGSVLGTVSGTISKGDGGVYTFTADLATGTGTLAEEGDYSEFVFLFSASPNGSRVFIMFDETIANAYSSEDGTETLVFDGYGNVTYTGAGRKVTGRFTYGDGLYKIEVSGDEKFEFKLLGETTFKRVSSEARLYTLYDPSSSEQLRLVIDGDGQAELRRYDEEDERWNDTPFVTGTYAPTERAGEWQFISANKSIYGDFKFILPSDTPLISFMKYDENAAGKFVSSDWTVLVLDGYSGYYESAVYVDANGAIHEGNYTTAGQIVVFTDGNASYNLKLLGAGSFKRIGDELGNYNSYDPVSNQIYSTPEIYLDGEGGAVLYLTTIDSIAGTYQPYGNSGTEYLFTYTDGESGKQVSFRFKTVSGTSYRLFMLHDDLADGTFTDTDGGRMELDGYKNAVYTDGNGVIWNGFCYSAVSVPLSDDKVILMTFVGLKEGGDSANEDDILLANYLLSRDGMRLEETALHAGAYYEYMPATMGVYNVQMFLDGSGNVYLQVKNEDGTYVWVKGDYSLDAETESEGVYSVEGDEEHAFILTYIQTSLSGYTACFVRFNANWAGDFTLEGGEDTLSLDGFGNGTYTVGTGEEAVTHYGIVSIYSTDYITDATVVITEIDEEGYTTGYEFIFKIHRGETFTFRLAGEEANYYYGYSVSSSGASYVSSVRLLLDGDGKAEYHDVDSDGVFTLKSKGTYEKINEEDKNGNTVITWRYTPDDPSKTGFDFQIRYVQEYFMSGYIPCFAVYDEAYAGTYTCSLNDKELVLEIDGYELATYTDANGETHTGTYHRSGDEIVFVKRDDKGASVAKATFKIVRNADGTGTFTISSDLA